MISLRFSFDGLRLIAGGSDGRTCAWEIASGAIIWSMPTASRKWIRSIAFSPDGETLAAAGDDGVITIRGTGEGRLLRALGSARTQFSVVSQDDEGR
ncbi:MAG: WD40 repeat domain-containing protein [Polyangiaceae bacterium]